MEMQATDVMSGQMPLREPQSGWGQKSAVNIPLSAINPFCPIGANNGECHGLNTVRSSVLYWVGGWWRMAAVCRLETGVQMPVLTSRKSKRRFRVDSGVKRANTPTQEGWRRKERT